jgi:amidase
LGKAAVSHVSLARQSRMQEPLCELSAVDLARLIREGELSAREVTAAHLRRIDALNPKLNAVVTVVPEQAMAAAGTADELRSCGTALGALHGLPVLHKDLQPTRGIRTTWGSPIYREFIPESDSLLVERMRNAGAITLGKTNTPEFGAGSQTYNTVFGATRNPWDITKTCGGSSGGSAVALASGMACLADGSDLGGSLRNPAAFCSVVGLRTSAGRVPSWPASLGWSPLAVEGPMARSVADVALFLAAIAGPDPRAPLSISEPGAAFATSLGRDFKGARVAWWTDLGGIPFEAPLRDIVNAQRRVFESLGCVVEDAEPDWTDVDTTFRVLRSSGRLLELQALRAQYGSLLNAPILAEMDAAERLTAYDLGMAQVRQTEIYQHMRQFMQRYEFFVLPVTQVSPFDVTQPYPTEIEGIHMDTYIDWMKSCYYISMTAAPAISVPCGFTAEGLPVGLQIVARHRDERGLLQLAYAFEQAVGISRRPSL